MKDQLTLLSETDWNVLIILDACRADYFHELVPRAEVVRSPAGCTGPWFHALVKSLRKERPPLRDVAISSSVLYFTANPVIDRELEQLPQRGKPCRIVQRISLWKELWRYHGPDRDIPTVHPADVAEVVCQDVHDYGQPRRMVVHFLQPHSPYIGDTPLAMTRWGHDDDEMSRRCRALPRPDKAVESGDLTWDDVRQAYRDNLKLVMQHAARLTAQLKGTVVITSDHGEILGEHGGRFGHEPGWKFPELFAVPWLVEQRPPLQDGRVPSTNSFVGATRQSRSSDEDGLLHQRLKELGYE